MATYSAVTAGQKDADSPINVSLIDKLDQNPHAIAEGASGAPKIQSAALDSNVITQDKMADAAIGQAELKTGQAAVSSTALAATGGEPGVRILLTGGEYCFYPETSYDYVSGGGSGGDKWMTVSVMKCWENVDVSYGPYVHFEWGDYTTTNATAYARTRYVNASPPHKIDTVDYADFIFIRLSNSGDILAASIASDPPWYHNGPTQFKRDHFDKNLKKWMYRKVSIPTSRRDMHPKKAMKRLEEFRKSKAEPMSYDMKNADMDIIQHPFITKSQTDRILIVEPSGTCYQNLCDLMENGENVLQIIHGGYIKIKTDDIRTRGKPKDVPMHSIEWKK